jgi:hypothetical protein
MRYFTKSTGMIKAWDRVCILLLSLRTINDDDVITSSEIIAFGGATAAGMKPRERLAWYRAFLQNCFF